MQTGLSGVGAEVTRLDHGSLECIKVDRVALALTSEKFDLVTLVHVETSSGIVNPIEEIGRLVADTDAIYFVDTACSAGAMKVETDAWRIDVGVTGSHKCLSAVPGLAVITLSDKAWQRLSQSSSMGSYFEFRQWWENCVVRPTTPPFTQPTTLVLALREALLEISRNGMETWWQKHTSSADAFMRAMRDAGFVMLLDESQAKGQRSLYSDTVMAIRYPARITDEMFRRVMIEEYGIFVIGNVGEFAGSSFRVGLMSPAQLNPINMFGSIAAFQKVSEKIAS